MTLEEFDEHFYIISSRADVVEHARARAFFVTVTALGLHDVGARSWLYCVMMPTMSDHMGILN